MLEELQQAIALAKKPQVAQVAQALADIVARGTQLAEHPTVANAADDAPGIAADLTSAIGKLKMLFPGYERNAICRYAADGANGSEGYRVRRSAAG